MTSDQLQAIRKQWLSPGQTDFWRSLPPDISRAAADIQKLLAEVERLQASCDEITRQYARLCARCRTGALDLCSAAS